MKKLALAAAFSVVATAGFAGNPAPAPVLDPVVIVEDTSSSAGGILVPLMALILLAAAASS